MIAIAIGLVMIWLGLACWPLVRLAEGLAGRIVEGDCD